MYKFFLFLIIISASTSYGQKKQYKSFKITIILPDTVTLDNTLRQFVDTIPRAHLDSTFMLPPSIGISYDPKSGLTLAEHTTKQRKAEDEFMELKKNEAAVNHIKPGLLIAQTTSERMKKWFNSNQSHSALYEDTDSLSWVARTEIIEDKSIKSLKRLQKIADSLASDYVIFYSDVSTVEIKKTEFKIKITTVLYSRKERIILYKQQTVSGIDKYAWNDINPLNLLLAYGVDPFAPKLYEIIEKKQRK